MMMSKLDPFPSSRHTCPEMKIPNMLSDFFASRLAFFTELTKSDPAD
jgi:hypothetical protein